MKILTVVLFIALFISGAKAEKFNYRFNSVNLSESLTRVAEDHPNLNLNFIYDELDRYKTSARVETDDPAEALRQIIGLNPVTIMQKGNRFYIEALQHGKFCYAGQTVGPDNEPVAAAPVMLLAPNDSSMITYGITDSDGRFAIPCDRMGVIAKATCVGYKATYKNCKSFATAIIVMEALPIQLHAVNVAAVYSETSTDRTIYRPTQRQKNASQTAIDLLRNLAMPQITVNLVNESVTTLAGDAVAIYINGLPASAAELAGIRTADVRMVEYLQFPTDPCFNGREHVINFIMQQYEYGGYTKLSANDNILTGLSSRAALYSKFTYKNMVFDLYAGSSNHDLHHAGASRIGKYTLSDGDGRENIIVRHEVFDGSRYIYNQYPVTLRAVYDSDKAQIANTAGFNFDQNSVAETRGHLLYRPNTESDCAYSISQPYVARHFTWSGSYYFILPNDFRLNINPGANYGYTDYSYRYTASLPGHEIIDNTSAEHYYNLRGSASIYKGFSDKHSLRLNLYGGTNSNTVRYRGTSPFDNHFSDSYAALQLGYNYNDRKWRFDSSVALQWERNGINGQAVREVYPLVNISGSYSPSQNHSADFFFHYGANYPGESVKTPNVLQDNELMYKTGNPDLPLSRQITFNMQYNRIAGNKFSMSVFGRYFGEYHLYVPVFLPYNNGRALLKSYSSNQDYNRTQIGASFNLKLFDGSLQLAGQPSISIFRYKGYYDMSRAPLAFNASVAYYIHRFYFQASYQLANKTIQGNLGVWYRDRDFYQLQAGWGNSNWNIRLSAINMLRGDWLAATQTLSSPLYSETMLQEGTYYHRRINLAVTYTFGYGKKIQRGNEVGEQRGGASAILK